MAASEVQGGEADASKQGVLAVTNPILLEDRGIIPKARSDCAEDLHGATMNCWRTAMPPQSLFTGV